MSRARTNPSRPQAHAICDRCGFRYNHVDLRWQMDWAGPSLINKRILVCQRCTDVPQEQLRTIVLPADPMPIQNPRPENFVLASSARRITSTVAATDPTTGLPIPEGTQRLTQADKIRFVQQTGEPPGGLDTTPGVNISVPDDIGGSDPGLPYQNDEIPNTGPLT